MKTETLDVIGAVGNKVTIAGAGTAGLGWLTASEFAAIMGALVALGGFFITWYYKREANKRLALEHALRQQERQLRIDMMRKLGVPLPQGSESDFADMGADE